MQTETMMGEFATVEDLVAWLELQAHEWRVSARDRAQLETAARAMGEAVGLGYRKDYVVTFEVKVFLKREGPKRPGRLEKRQRQLAEQWRASRAGTDEPGGS